MGPVQAWRTKMGLEEVMTPKGNEGPHFLPRTPAFARAFQRKFDGGSQVVVTDAMWNASEMLECLQMSIQKTLLSLGRKGHRKRPARVAQAHQEELHFLAFA